MPVKEEHMEGPELGFGRQNSVHEDRERAGTTERTRNELEYGR